MEEVVQMSNNFLHEMEFDSYDVKLFGTKYSQFIKNDVFERRVVDDFIEACRANLVG